LTLEICHSDRSRGIYIKTRHCEAEGRGNLNRPPLCHSERSEESGLRHCAFLVRYWAFLVRYWTFLPPSAFCYPSPHLSSEDHGTNAGSHLRSRVACAAGLPVPQVLVCTRRIYGSQPTKRRNSFKRMRLHEY